MAPCLFHHRRRPHHRHRLRRCNLIHVLTLPHASSEILLHLPSPTFLAYDSWTLQCSASWHFVPLHYFIHRLSKNLRLLHLVVWSILILLSSHRLLPFLFFSFFLFLTPTPTPTPFFPSRFLFSTFPFLTLFPYILYLPFFASPCLASPRLALPSFYPFSRRSFLHISLLSPHFLSFVLPSPPFLFFFTSF